MADIQAEDIFQGVLVMFRDDIGIRESVGSTAGPPQKKRTPNCWKPPLYTCIYHPMLWDNMGFCLGLLPGLVIIMEAFLGCLFVGTFHEVSIMVKIQPRFPAESCCRSF